METINKTTLIIDGNWLLMSRLGMVKDTFNKNLSPEELQQSKNDMVDFVAQSINKAINFWGDTIDNVIMVQDGGSWRKDLPRPKLYTTTYKGNRVADEDMAWDWVWKALDEICKTFHDNHIMCVTEKTIEGDDWCWYWSRYLNRCGINTIIWTSDADLKQLVQKDEKTGAWTAWYNDRAGLVVHEVFNQSEMDILMNFDSKDVFMEQICKQSRSVTYINPDDIVMEKVICGDAGDNIKSILRWETSTKSGKPKVLQVSPKEWMKVKEHLHIQNFKEFEDQKQLIISNLLALGRFDGYRANMEDLLEMFDFNVKLVRLAKEQIPHHAAMLMNQHKDEYQVTDMGYLRNNYKVLASKNEVVEDLFKDMPF